MPSQNTCKKKRRTSTMSSGANSGARHHVRQLAKKLRRMVRKGLLTRESLHVNKMYQEIQRTMAGKGRPDIKEISFGPDMVWKRP
jgi:ribosomal protein S20